MKRVFTALVLIPVVLYGVFLGPWWVLLILTGLVALQCFLEYCHILHVSRPAQVVGSLAGIACLLLRPEQMFLPLLLTALVTLTLPFEGGPMSAAFTGGSAMFLGILYTFASMKTALLLKEINPWWLFFGLAINWVGDSGAYYVGQRFGRHKLAPKISPNKSWEGTAASVVCSIAFGLIVLPHWLHVAPASAVLLALAGNAAGQIGDLAESALKRGAGVKDSGTLLPGHGGMLDRVDSMLFTLPVIYGLVTYLH